MADKNLIRRITNQTLLTLVIFHSMFILFATRGAYRYLLWVSSGILVVTAYALGVDHGSKKKIKRLAEASQEIKQITHHTKGGR